MEVKIDEVLTYYVINLIVIAIGWLLERRIHLRVQLVTWDLEVPLTCDLEFQMKN